MSEQTVETMTPYAASKIVNKWLEEAGTIDPKTGSIKKLPPQMFYTYVNKGYIVSVDKKCVTRADLKDWFDNKYKQSKKVEESEKVEFDNDGTVGEWN